MIVKEPRSSNFEDKSDIGKYNLRVLDKNGNSFVMMVGGNGDLYWVPNNYKKNKTFIIEKSDEFVYDIFDKLCIFEGYIKDEELVNRIKTAEEQIATYDEWQDYEVAMIVKGYLMNKEFATLNK